MTPSARTLANRRNARRSTGPKSAVGKARVAKNALRHGLATPISSDATLSELADQLAMAIAGSGADDVRLEHAKRIAEAQVDLQRVRKARGGLQADFSDAALRPPQALPKEPSIRELIRTVAKLARTDELDARAGDVLRRLADKASAASSRPQQQPSVLEQLARLDRYDRRALSRLKMAIRDFDALDRASA